jgi:hypothetical protein
MVKFSQSCREKKIKLSRNPSCPPGQPELSGRQEDGHQQGTHHQTL